MQGDSTLVYLQCYKNIIFLKLKPGYSLDSDQEFVLASVNNGYSRKEILKATNLDEKRFENLMDFMLKRKLLTVADGKYKLTEVSKKLLFVKKTVSDINEESIALALDSTCNNVYIYSSDQFGLPSSNSLILKKYGDSKKRQIESHVVHDNQELIIKTTAAWRNLTCSKEYEEYFFKSLFIEVKSDNDFIYKKFPLKINPLKPAFINE